MNSDNYVMPFGKYKMMKLNDIIKIKTVDKDGQDKQTGLLYLQWLITQDWFKHKDIVNEVISKCNSDTKIIDKKEKAKKITSKKVVI